MQYHPVLLDHSAMLSVVHGLTDKQCAERGEADAYLELWQAMQAGEPMIVLEAALATRRARKQLLHKLSKQPSASRYSWEALVATETSEQMALPTLEEGWQTVYAFEPAGPN